jgi:DNA-binding GntR family transcriptional regulator
LDRLLALDAERLSQRQIAGRLGVGQGTVRRALVRLRPK